MSLYRRNDSPVFWTRFKFRGREYRRSTGVVDKRSAKAFERKYRAGIEGTTTTRTTTHTLPDMEALDIRRASNRRRDLGTQTLSTLRIAWGHLVAYYGALAPSRIDAEAVAAYVASRRSDGVRGQTIRRELATLRRGLVLAGIVPPQFPTVDSDTPRASQAGKYVEPGILTKWVAALPQDAHDVALFAALTGLRAQEISRVRLAWLATAPSGVVLHLPADATKTRKARTIGLPAEAVAILKRYPQGFQIDPTVLRRAFARASLAVGVGAIHLRDLRHTYATLALEETGDLRATMEALGHTTLAAASRYQSSTTSRTTAVAMAVGARLRAVR